MSSHFTHAQLGQERDAIRLVTVEPCFSPTDQIVCTLHNSCVSADVGYLALSYVWGLPSDQDEMILLNDKLFQVRNNLRDFLLHARMLWPGRYLWIDAICIDQTETGERNHQVKIMGQIYENASQVVSWLGTGNNDVVLRSIFQSVNHRKKVHNQICQSIKYVKYLPNLEQKLYKYQELPWSLSHLSWIPPKLVHMLLLPYWQRTWIVQEILLAKNLTFMCGDAILHCHDLMNMFIFPCPSSAADEKAASAELSSWYNTQRLQSSDMPWSVRLLLRRTNPISAAKELTLDTMIDTMCDTKCFNPQDHIFGLLSLVRLGPTFAVNYHEPATVLVLKVLQHFGGDLDFVGRLMRCMGVGFDELYAAAQCFRHSGNYKSTAPGVIFEIENACCCEVKSNLVHAGGGFKTSSSVQIVQQPGHQGKGKASATSGWSNNQPDKSHDELTSDTCCGCWQETGNPVMLCLKCVGARTASLHAIEDNFEVSGRQSRETGATDKSGREAIRFSSTRISCAPLACYDRGVTRYQLPIDAYIGLLRRSRSIRVPYGHLPHTSTEASAAAGLPFLGCFPGDRHARLPPQQTARVFDTYEIHVAARGQARRGRGYQQFSSSRGEPSTRRQRKAARVGG